MQQDKGRLQGALPLHGSTAVFKTQQAVALPAAALHGDLDKLLCTKFAA